MPGGRWMDHREVCDAIDFNRLLPCSTIPPKSTPSSSSVTSAHAAARCSGFISTQRRLTCRASSSSAGHPSRLMRPASWRLRTSVLAGLGTTRSIPSNAVSMWSLGAVLANESSFKEDRRSQGRERFAFAPQQKQAESLVTQRVTPRNSKEVRRVLSCSACRIPSRLAAAESPTRARPGTPSAEAARSRSMPDRRCRGLPPRPPAATPPLTAPPRSRHEAPRWPEGSRAGSSGGVAGRLVG